MLPDILHVCKQLQIKTSVVPMLFQEGAYFEKLKQICMKYDTAYQLPFCTSKEAVESLIHHIESYRKQEHSLLIVYHSSQAGRFAEFVSMIHYDADTIIVHEKQLDQLDCKMFHKHVDVYSLYMLSGVHKINDQKLLNSMYSEYDFHILPQSFLLEESFFITRGINVSD